MKTASLLCIQILYIFNLPFSTKSNLFFSVKPLYFAVKCVLKCRYIVIKMKLKLLEFLIKYIKPFLFFYFSRSYLLMNIPEEGENKLTDAKLQGYAAVLSIGSTRCKANLLGSFGILFCFFKNIPSVCTLSCCLYLFNIIVL